MDKETFTVANNEKEQRYEVHAGGETAFLGYRFYKNDIALMHTLVPDSLNGKGIASTLAHHALEAARTSGRRVLVYCPFVATYLKRHPEYNDLVGHRDN